MDSKNSCTDETMQPMYFEWPVYVLETTEATKWPIFGPSRAKWRPKIQKLQF